MLFIQMKCPCCAGCFMRSTWRHAPVLTAFPSSKDMTHSGAIEDQTNNTEEKEKGTWTFFPHARDQRDGTLINISPPLWTRWLWVEKDFGWSRSHGFSPSAHAYLEIRPSIVDTYKISKNHTESSRLSDSQFPLLPKYLRNLLGKSTLFEQLLLLILCCGGWWIGQWPCVVSPGDTSLIRIC